VTAAAAIDGPLVSVRDLARRLRDPNVLILDATVILPAPRFDGDYRASSGESRWLAAHIPGARFADLLGNLSVHDAPYHFAVPDPGTLAEAFRSLGVDDDKHVVVYDADYGLWAARLWWMLRSLGIRAAILDGGFAQWRLEDQPIESGAVAPIPGAALTIRIDPQAWVSRARVEAIMRGDEAGTLINALSPELFNGTAPTRYRRRGHIPGSRNFPARQLFARNGEYLRPPELALQATPVLAGAARPFILYCGGGISAAANAFALSLLGETEVSIYDGSLEEWAADPALPLAVDTTTIASAFNLDAKPATTPAPDATQARKPIG
jgi:thiosulfate/3-mercaptopyruvate sulfurtransferase